MADSDLTDDGDGSGWQGSGNFQDSNLGNATRQGSSNLENLREEDDNISLTLADVNVPLSARDEEFVTSSVTFNISNPYFVPLAERDRCGEIIDGKKDWRRNAAPRPMVAPSFQSRCNRNGGSHDYDDSGWNENGLNMSGQSRDIESLIGDVSLQSLVDRDDNDDNDDDDANELDMLRKLMHAAENGGHGGVSSSVHNRAKCGIKARYCVGNIDYRRSIDASPSGDVNDKSSSFDANRTELCLFGESNQDPNGESDDGREALGLELDSSKKVESSARVDDVHLGDEYPARNFGRNARFSGDSFSSKPNQSDRKSPPQEVALEGMEGSKHVHYVPQRKNKENPVDDPFGAKLPPVPNDDPFTSLGRSYRRSSSTTIRWKNTWKGGVKGQDGRARLGVQQP